MGTGLLQWMVHSLAYKALNSFLLTGEHNVLEELRHCISALPAENREIARHLFFFFVELTNSSHKTKMDPMVPSCLFYSLNSRDSAAIEHRDCVGTKFAMERESCDWGEGDTRLRRGGSRTCNCKLFFVIQRTYYFQLAVFRNFTKNAFALLLSVAIHWAVRYQRSL